MQSNFRTYQLAVQFYRAIKPLKMESHLKDQLRRAASSVVLNLAEGSGRGSKVDQRRFYQIALGSLRESRACLELIDEPCIEAEQLADATAACLWKLIQLSVKLPPSGGRYKRTEKTAAPDGARSRLVSLRRGEENS
jgi:four helix bundle protein